ncbi:MAG: hypothetical protein R6X19_02025 [Kiritimatiellia bacterium]
MKKLTREQQQFLVRVWDKAGPELERIRKEELRGLPYNWRNVVTLLEMGDYYKGPSRLTSGLVEMQRLFMKEARRQGLLPAAAREEPALYETQAGSGEKQAPKLALFCSVKCPGKLILEAYDLAQRLRNKEVTVIGGFHSPMERECLTVLLRSPNRVIWVLARGMIMRIQPEYKNAVAEKRLQIVAPFSGSVKRVTEETADRRNRIVAEMAEAVICVHAAPGSKIEALCRELLAAGKPLYTFEHPANEGLLKAGARPITIDCVFA